MAVTMVPVLTDDLDGTITTHSPTETPVETVRFSLDGEQYEIDLSKAHAAALREIYRPFLAAARLAGAAPGRSGKASRPRARSRADVSAVRNWAASQGLDVKPRGRVPAEIMDRYRAAHS